MPSGLFELVPMAAKRISESVTPGTPLRLTLSPESLASVVEGLLDESLELLHPTATSPSSATSASTRRSRNNGFMVDIDGFSLVVATCRSPRP